MKNKNRFKKADIKIFIVPFIIITSIFFIIGNATINGIENYYYNNIKEDSLNFAKNYSHSLSKSAKAYDVLNGLIEEKLLVASRTIALYNDHQSHELIKELADTLEVDKVYSYNSKGEIIYSNTGEFIGWKPHEGHPAYNFLMSDSMSLIEDIRQDIDTKNYYKYGYFKSPDGSFIQIGVRVDEVNNFLGNFKMQNLLYQMQGFGLVDRICFIDNDFNVVGSTDNDLIGKNITNKETKAAIVEDREYSFINNNDEEKEYEVFVPVYYERNKIGTLAMNKSLNHTEDIIRQVSTIGLLTLIVIYVSLLHIMLSTYRKNKKLIQLAYYDNLTALPNKQYLKEFLTEEIRKSKKDNKAVLLINCSNFRIVNLTFGFEYGDEILKELSAKIKGLECSNKKLFRFTANKYVLYIKNYNGQKDLITISNKISEIFNNPFRIKNVEQYLRVQIGIVEINSKYHNCDGILKDASISLNHIKNNDSVNYAFFNEVMEKKLQREDLIEKELRTAIASNDTKNLYLEFQPLVDLKTNKVTSFEALARMKTDNLGFVSPIEFIDVAEKKQLIIPLGNLILKRSCEFINNIKKQGYNDVKVAVNVSGIQLLYKDFTDTVVDIIKETDIEESNLELEITESVLLDNYDIVNEKLKNLREHKIRIALDDFGTGYSSFARLGELNIDTVKIDRYFISRISLNGYKELITGDIISMSHKLGLTVVAEGVELQEQKDFLIENNCDVMQGYLFSKPLLEEDAIKLLKIHNRKETNLI